MLKITRCIPTPGRLTLYAATILLLALSSNLNAGQPGIRLSTNSLDFGTLQVGNQSDLILTIFNDGASQLGILGLSGLPNQGFSLVNPPSVAFQVNPSSSIDLTIRFAPGSDGPFQAILNIAHNDLAQPSLNVNLSGSGTTDNPEIALSATSIFLGAVNLGNSSNQPFIIYNQGTTTLTVTGLTGLPSDGFSILSLPAGSFGVPAGSSRTFTIHFAPGSPGSHGATFQVLSNDADEGDLAVSLTGTGVSNPVCFIEEIPVSLAGLNIAGILSNVKVKHQKTGENKISGKVTISQLKMPDIPTSPTAGVPSLTVSVYLLDNPDPCALSQLPAPLLSVVTNAGKAGKPGRLGKSVKVKLSAITNEATTGKYALAVLDPGNAILELDKSDNFIVSPILP